MKLIAILILAATLSVANATCISSPGRVLVSSTHQPAVTVWDISFPGTSYRISTSIDDFIRIRENGKWLKTKWQSVLVHKPTGDNQTTCTLTRILDNYFRLPANWKK
jgi:hypothetical protein